MSEDFHTSQHGITIDFIMGGPFNSGALIFISGSSAQLKNTEPDISIPIVIPIEAAATKCDRLLASQRHRTLRFLKQLVTLKCKQILNGKTFASISMQDLKDLRICCERTISAFMANDLALV